MVYGDENRSAVESVSADVEHPGLRRPGAAGAALDSLLTPRCPKAGDQAGPTVPHDQLAVTHPTARPAEVM